MTWALHRVDDRLIHGQVVIAWGHRLHPRRIWIVDDASADNPWEREMLSAVAPGIDVRVRTVAEALAEYGDEQTAPGNAFLLVRSLGTALALVERGVPIRSLNLGGIHYAPGRDKVNEYLYLGDEERRAARALVRAGVVLEVQDVPASRPLPLSDLVPEIATP